MKLTKKDVYIDLRGKSKDELTELYNFLESIGEKQYRKTLKSFLDYCKGYETYHLSNNWTLSWYSNTKEKTEVTIQQLKEILKPKEMTRNQELIEEAKRRGYTHNNFKCLNKSYNRTSIESLDKWYYDELEDTLFTNTRMNGGKAVYKNGVWAEIIKPMETKEDQLIKEAKERGFLTEGNEFYSCFSDKNKLRIIEPYNSKLEINLYLDKGGCLRYYDGLNNKYDESLCSNPAIYKDGVWAEIKNNNLTLTEQLQKAEAEVKRLKEVIEEENEIKVGDLVKCTNKESRAKCVIGVVEDLHPGYVGVGGHWYDKF